MTLPGSRFPRLDPVAVGATHNALMTGDLGLDCRNGLQLRNVRGLSFHVVDVESSRVRLVSAVDASARDLELGYPRLDQACTVVRNLVVARLCLGIGNPSEVIATPRLGTVYTLGSGAIRAKRGAVLGRVAFRQKRTVTLLADPLSRRRIFPGRHNQMISARDDRNPCKPDIFEATYEVAS